jgi:hypothetical protein
MGYKTVSQNKVSAKTAESSAVTLTANISGNGYVISGPYTTLNSTAIYKATVTPGSTSTKSPIVVAGLAGNPTITGVQYLNSVNQIQTGLTAVSTLGGSILISGSNFTPNVTVWLGNTRVANTVISSVQILAILPANAAGNANILVAPAPPPPPSTVNIQFYPAPVWQNSNVNLYYTMNNTSSNIPLTVTTTTGDTVTFSNTALPIGLTLLPNVTNFGNGTFQGYASGTISSYPGGYNNVAFSITAINSKNESTSQAFTANVNAPVPVWTGGNTFVFTQNGSSITTQVVATISDGVPLTYSNTTALPVGLSINANGYITGTVTGYGIGSTCVPFTLVVSDAEGQSNTQSFSANITSGYTINYVAVGGGGGSPGAGGGAGGVFRSGTYCTIPGVAYTVTIGGAGAGKTGTPASRGGTTCIMYTSPALTVIGSASGGGSGGPGGAIASNYGGGGGSNADYSGGGSGGVISVGSGGGAGSGGNGASGHRGRASNPCFYMGGNGGIGTKWSVNCTYYGGGGGGGTGCRGASGTPASPNWSCGGTGGGGGGRIEVSICASPGVSGSPSSGGGGGGGQHGGSGGSGIAFIYYCSPVQIGTGGCVSGGPAGPRWIHTFTGLGTYTS